MTSFRKTNVTLTPKAAPFAIRAEKVSDVVARETLLDACFGDNRHLRTCQRLRDGRAPAEGLAFSAIADGRLVGTLRLWHVSPHSPRAAKPAAALSKSAMSGREPASRLPMMSGLLNKKRDQMW